MDALLLDVGGTLLRPRERVDHVYVRLGAPFGVTHADFAHAFSGPGAQLMDGRPFWRGVVQRATGCADPVYFEQLYAFYARADAWVVAPGARAVLRDLRARGVGLAVVSNWDTRLRPTLDALGLSTMVDVIACSGELGVQKPDPRIFHAACRTLGVSPGRAVHLGDSWESDVLGARAAGCRAVHYQGQDWRELGL